MNKATRQIIGGLLLTAATVTACSKNDNNDTTPPANEVTLLAKWNQVSAPVAAPSHNPVQ